MKSHLPKTDIMEGKPPRKIPPMKDNRKNNNRATNTWLRRAFQRAGFLMQDHPPTIIKLFIGGDNHANL